MPRSFSVTGSLALPDHIVWALCAVPPLGTARQQTVSDDPTSILATGPNPTFSGYDDGCLEKHMSCERNLRRLP